MKLTKENIYINLQGKSKEELMELKNILFEFKQNTFREDLISYYYENQDDYNYFHFDSVWAADSSYHLVKHKTEVTIEQLKEILKPMETFTPIAMRCTQEQFDAIKPKLRGLEIEDIRTFDTIKYLVNNLGGEAKVISNVTYFSKGDHNRKVHEEWNEKIFLKACGIEIEPLNNKNMVDLMGYSVLVDNEEQARKLQEIAFEQGFKWKYGDEIAPNLDVRSFHFGYDGTKVIVWTTGKAHYQNDFIIKKAHFNDLFEVETLQEKEQRLLKELEEVRKEIEDSKIKVGDFVYNNYKSVFYKKYTDVINEYERKITNPELIKLLEQEVN